MHNCMVDVCRDRTAFTEGVPPVRLFTRWATTVGADNYLAIAALDAADSVVGWCDVLRQPTAPARHVGALSIGVRDGSRRRGLGLELLTTCVRGAFLVRGFQRLQVSLFPENEPARSLYASIGFQSEGIARQSRIVDGVPRDVLEMGLLQSDWLARGDVQSMLEQMQREPLPVAKPVRSNWWRRLWR
jgi:RimJ/RimL family protein N-acetyltransferase